MPNRDPDAYRAYMREYTRKRKLGLVPVLRQASLESVLESPVARALERLAAELCDISL